MKLKIKSFIIFIFLLNLSIVQGQDMPNDVFSIEKSIQNTNSKTNWTKIDTINFGVKNNGGVAQYYYAEKEIKKITVQRYAETHKIISAYYLSKDSVTYALEKNYTYHKPISSKEFDFNKSTIEEIESYFIKDKLVVHTSKIDSVSHPSKLYLKKEETRLLSDFKQYLKLSEYDAKAKPPILLKDTIVFGLLMLALGFIFYTSSIKQGFWSKFYGVVPALFVAYMLPAVFTTTGLIAPEWETVSQTGELIKHKSNLYFMSSRYLLPAALVLMTLSIDLKAVYNLGWKALVMFFTGTVGIIIGGPIAILLISMVSPETVGGAGPDAVWRGLSTLAGSWIGGGANQTAMLEIYGFNQKLYGGMVFVDIVVANVWMAIILIGIGKSKRIDKWLGADTSAIEKLKEKVSSYSKEIERNPSLSDLMILAAIAFGTVSFAHFGAGYLSQFFENFVEGIHNETTKNMFTFLSSKFFWMISLSTIIAILLSFTKAKNYEGAGASKYGSVFIYILVASIGMKMDLTLILDNVGLIGIGVVWMTIHAVLLIIVAKLIKAPYLFLAVGSQANVGGAASAPIVAAAFHPSLATVGVLLAVFGYAVGTIGAIVCTILMQIVAQ
jgi:uncharacterized membrane protein